MGVAMIRTRSVCLMVVAVGLCLAGGMAATHANVPEPDRVEEISPTDDVPAQGGALQESGGEIGTREEFDPVPLAGPFEHPWSIGFMPDGTILVTERPGRLQRIRPGEPAQEVGNLREELGSEIVTLLDLALDPDFANNHTLYLSYGHGSEACSTLRVARVRLDAAGAKLADAHVIFESKAAAKPEQYGGRIALTGQGHLFLTVGDRWERDRAQDLSDPAGKIVRIRVDGTIPVDNPFVGVPGARPEIWSYGHRNPLGIALDRRSGRLWAHENGPLGGDELNLILKGSNYGWPVVSFGLDYSGDPIGEGVEKEIVEHPVQVWLAAVAPSGLTIEQHSDEPVFWIGALVGQALIKLEVKGDRIVRERRLLYQELGRIRDVRIGPDGFLYVVTDDPQGSLYRLDPVLDQSARRTQDRPL